MGENRGHGSLEGLLGRPEGTDGTALGTEGFPMKGPWWALPGVAAIIGTLTIVSAAQGSLTTARIPMPGAVQVATPGMVHRLTPPPPQTTEPTDGQVVAPSRPVVTQTGDSGSNTAVTSRSVQDPTAGSAPSSDQNSTAQGNSSGGQASSDPGSGPAISTAGGEGQSPSSTSTPVETTTSPPVRTSTTTTATPPRGEGGDH